MHIFSGFGALVGSLLVGPRSERLGDNFRDVSLPGHSLPLTAIGGLFVIIGMIGKTSGMTDLASVGQLAVNTLVSGAGGGLVTMTLFKVKTRREKKYSLGEKSSSSNINFVNRKWSFLVAFNGFFTGMVCVSGTGADLPSWGAFLSGVTGGLIFFLLSGLLRLNKVDDPVHGVGVHLSGGVVGAVVVGVVNLSRTQNGLMIGWQIVGLIAVSAWSCACFLLLLLPLLLCGKLRIRDNDERLGTDAVKIKEPAYNFSTPSPHCSSENRGTQRTDVFLTPNTGTRPGNMSCQLSEINKRSQYSDLHLQEMSPRTVLELPSPAAGDRSSLSSSVVPASPPYPTSTMKKQGSNLEVPELTITSSCCDSEAPLIVSSVNTSLSDTTAPVLATLDIRELKKSIKNKRETLRQTHSKYSIASSTKDDINSSDDEQGDDEVVEVKDDVQELNKPADVKTNEAQGNFSNDEINETEIDITKYLKSPEPTKPTKDDNDDDEEKVKTVVKQQDAKKEVKMFESSITFVSDDDSDFEEKLI